MSLFDFVNTKGLFPAVQTVERFSLLTYAGVGGSREPIRLATLCQEPADLAKPGRQYTLSPEDVALMSPYNGAMPLLKGDRDAAIIRRIYSEFPYSVTGIVLGLGISGMSTTFGSSIWPSTRSTSAAARILRPSVWR